LKELIERLRLSLLVGLQLKPAELVVDTSKKGLPLWMLVEELALSLGLKE
jgi:hypothetical protein